MTGWRVIQRLDGRWQLVCPNCGSRGGVFFTREQAERIARASVDLHIGVNH